MLNLDRFFSRFKNVDIFFADSLCGKSTARRAVHELIKGTPRRSRPLVIDTDALHMKGHSDALLAVLRVYAADYAHVIVLTNDIDFTYAAIRGGAVPRCIAFFSPTVEGAHTFANEWLSVRGEPSSRSLARLTEIALKIGQIDDLFGLPTDVLVGFQIVTPSNLTLVRSLIQSTLHSLIQKYIFERSNNE